MPIEIKITGDTMADINAAVKGMIGLNANTAPLDDLLAVTSARFAKEGFKVTIDEADKPDVAAAPPPEAVPVGAEVAAEAAPDELPKRRRGRPAGSVNRSPPMKKPEPEAEPEDDDDTNVVQMTPKPDPDGDRTYVLDTLSERFADSRQKVRTKAFIDKVAGRNGGVRLSRLPSELFPAIRAEMDAYFNPGNNGGGHAA